MAKGKKHKKKSAVAMTPEEAQQHTRDGLADAVAVIRAYLKDDRIGLDAILGNTPCKNCLMEWVITCSVALATVDCETPDEIAEGRKHLDEQLAVYQARVMMEELS